MKKHPHVVACVLLLLSLASGLSLQEDDLVFDDVGEDNDNDYTPAAAGLPLTNHSANHHQYRSDRLLSEHHPDEPSKYHSDGSSSRNTKRHASFEGVERLWGVPDVVTMVGHVFKMRIPDEAFAGDVDFYEVTFSR